MRRRVSVLTVAVLLGASTTALASRAPSRSARRAIVAAIHHDREVGISSDYRVVDIRVSSRGPYARAGTVPRNRSISYQGQLVVLRHSHGRWRVIEFGSAGVGCLLPPAVQRDLKVTPPATYCRKH